MPEINAFRGIRYDLGHVGSLSDVVAPPYDVIDEGLQERLYKAHPCNVIRLILNRAEEGDEADSKYDRAARYLKNWLREGSLSTEPDPAIYVYHQVFEYEDVEYVRRGFMSRMRLEPFGTGKVFPHEQTHSAAKADRLKLTRATRANLSQIFGIYSDPDNSAQSILEEAIRGVAPLEASDHLGVIHRIWPMTDVNIITQVSSLMAPRPLYIADGHHRYETALNYRAETSELENLASSDGKNFVLTMCISMDDPGMIVLPTHRLFRGLPKLTSEQLAARLQGHFSIEIWGEGQLEAAGNVWEKIAIEDDQGQIGLFCPLDNKWLLASINEGGIAALAASKSEQSEDWRGLGVSILHHLILEQLLETAEYPKPTYVHLVEELVAELSAPTGEEPYDLAALVMPATLDHIRAISEHGERMPAKSTYFYPKLLSGLVINPLT